MSLGAALWAALPRRARADAKARAAILLYMEGGPSQIDTWDPKPGRPTGGEFKAIATTVAGIQISEHLPGLAQRMKRLAIVRSVTAKEGNHQRARHLMHTGYAPQGGVDHPAFGSLVAEKRAPGDLPGYVAVGGPGEDAGFLSAELSPFFVQNATKPVRYLAPAGVGEPRFARRMELWRSFENEFLQAHPSRYARTQRAVGEKAIAMMHSPHVAAFKLDDEPAATKEAYGDGEFGMGCLMARRLVEAGVPFVEVTLKGWDTHKDNFATVKRLSADLDRGMGALVDDLAARGLLDQTLVVWLGDFGRTPTINGNGGRDHYPGCQSVVLAGGGIRGGQAVGATDADGAAVKDRPVEVPDLFRTLATQLGLDPDERRVAPSGRPIKTVDGGKVVAELV
jgi:uncharacterized protein (DUF1501 family)